MNVIAGPAAVAADGAGGLADGATVRGAGVGAALPVAGLTLLIAGFNPTRIDTANRHLLLGRVTLLDLAAQVIGIRSMVVLAVV
jgi:hypothetical protein